MNHDDCDGPARGTRDTGGKLGGHEAVIGAAKREAEKVVEVGCWVIVGEGVVDGHVFEEIADVFVEELLYLG